MDIKCPNCGRNEHFAKETDVVDAPFCRGCGARLLPEDKTEMYEVIRSAVEDSRKAPRSVKAEGSGKTNRKLMPVIAAVLVVIAIAATLILAPFGGKKHQVGDIVKFGS